MPKMIRILWAALLAALLLGAGACLALGALPPESWQALARWLKGGAEMRSLTPALIHTLRPPLLGLGAALLLGAAAWLRFLLACQSWLRAAGDLPREFRRLFEPLSPRRLGGRTAGLLLGLTAAGAALRAAYLNRPMFHDEAYTFMGFASRSLFAVVSDYSLPNNHVFHTLLVHFSTRIFGDAPWAVRLPAYLAGVLLIPALFLLARRWYGASAGWLAAGAAAVLPALINLSIDARGYSLLGLFSVLCAGLADLALRRKNPAAWTLLGLLGGLAFYTVPVALYPLGMIFLWLLVSALLRQFDPAYGSFWGFFWRWLGCGLGLGLLTLALYSPILVYAGPQALFGNSFVLPLSLSSLLQRLPGRLQDTWGVWTAGVGWIGGALLAVGFGLSLLFTRRRLLTAVGLGWMSAVLILQRPDPWPKIFSFALPLLVLWAAGGWAGWLSRLRSVPAWLGQAPTKLGRAALTAVLGVLLLFGVWRAATEGARLAQPGKEELAARFLAERLRPGDILAVTSPIDAPMWYYLRRLGVPDSVYRFDPTAPFTRTWAAASLLDGQTPEAVLRKRGLDPARLVPVGSWSVADVALSVYGEK